MHHRQSLDIIEYADKYMISKEYNYGDDKVPVITNHKIYYKNNIVEVLLRRVVATSMLGCCLGSNGQTNN
jgi:hypothetical protein